MSCLWLLPFAIFANGPSYIPFLNHISPIDSVKYRGYRLELTDFKMIKEKSEWLKISFTIVNSGRMNVDLGREGTEHWVVFNFDRSIFTAKLGGYRENIKRQLIKENFKLDASERIVGMELKIPNVLPLPPRKSAEEEEITTETQSTSSPNDDPVSSVSWGNLEAPTLPVALPENSAPETKTIAESDQQDTVEPPPCPDILLEKLTIIEEDDKWATVQFTITNLGEGAIYIFGNSDDKKDNLVLNAYLSGVTTLTRGAIPIGGKIITEEVRQRNELLQGESLTSRIRLDVRKKTRYMKSLILSAENMQFSSECDRTNNSLGVVLK
ncbi:MAG: hypothetical protein R2825_10405 [Saprospiraceae bacterium]